MWVQFDVITKVCFVSQQPTTVSWDTCMFGNTIPTDYMINRLVRKLKDGGWNVTIGNIEFEEGSLWNLEASITVLEN